MKFLRKASIFIRRHIDFLFWDLLTFTLAYFAAVQIRRSMDIRITHGELFIQFGLVCIVIFLVVEIVSQNLNGVMFRTIPGEAEAVGLQMVMTWSIYTVVLFLLKEAHEFSRVIYVTAFFVCFMCLWIERTAWKCALKYSKLHESISPRLLVICEGDHTQQVLQRILRGSFENHYEICGVVVDGGGESDYRDWYPHAVGLQNVPQFITDYRVQDAYVELSDAEKESAVIKQLLDAGVIVHRSLGDSKFDYVSQHVNDLSGKSVITIEGKEISLVSQADQLLAKIRKARREKKMR